MKVKRVIAKRMSAQAALALIAEIIEGVDQRAMAVDGPVPPTHREIRPDELRRIYDLARRRWAPREEGTAPR